MSQTPQIVILDSPGIVCDPETKELLRSTMQQFLDAIVKMDTPEFRRQYAELQLRPDMGEWYWDPTDAIAKVETP